VKHLKYQITLIIALVIGALVLQHLINSYNNTEKQKQIDELNKIHLNAVSDAKAGIDNYATLVSSIRGFIKNSKEFPKEKQIQNYLTDLLKDLKFNDSLLVNYVDKNHVIKYVITPNQIDPSNLKGISASDFRPKEEVQKLEDLMKQDSISLFPPINLKEGWCGFPFNFSAKNYDNEVVGYMVPILDVKYLLNAFYDNDINRKFVHKFSINDSINLSREAVYDGTNIYNTRRDNEFFKNFDLSNKDIISSNINLYGLNLNITSAYKEMPTTNRAFISLSYLWYVILILFSALLLFQLSKNKKLNTGLKAANQEIELKNEALENNLYKNQTLIKEIHHRVKNNMQMISGLLELQEDEYQDEKIIKALEESRNRIQSMSLVHEKLYNSASLQDVKTKEYIVQLIAFVENTIGGNRVYVSKEIDVSSDLIFDADTTANLGLIINELVTNSYKYAFSEKSSNKIRISIVKQKHTYKLIYLDNGGGLNKDYDFESSSSLGMKLVYVLTEQLNGQIKYDNKADTFIIYFNPMEKSFKG
jgi:two-component sensor histidine kinase